jgi:hypothetical protein
MACAAGDGYNDTLGGILEAELVGRTKWKELSRHLPRTYDDPAFADFAIGHIAVPVAGKLSEAQSGRCHSARTGPQSELQAVVRSPQPADSC